jgi:hypothetical protein
MFEDVRADFIAVPSANETWMHAFSGNDTKPGKAITERL